ncbi:MAG TPA: hypothetical protein VK686_24100 [Bryobacteraceae bacterium]|nr:hypothetical protein [Bryobacteraceae bacterium]
MSTSASVAKCDQACLDKTVDTDIAAKVAHDPSKVAWAPWVAAINISPFDLPAA